MEVAVSQTQELIDFPGARSGCFWLVEDLSAGRNRPCGNNASYYYGPHLAFCNVHEKKFLTAILYGLEDDPRFRDQVIKRIGACELAETALWVEQKTKIRQWPDRAARAHCVYFTEREGFVKIGRTSDIRKRMHDIGKGSCMPEGMSVGPVRLLAVIHCACTGGKCVRERHFHDRFRDKWLEGEWFLFDTEMAAFVGGLKDCLDDRLREVSHRDPLNELGEVLASHRESCTRCKPGTGCSTYLRIVRDHTERRHHGSPAVP
jgi:T5orf172 domain